jgi:apolipoprotein N-acyltransferase
VSRLAPRLCLVFASAGLYAALVPTDTGPLLAWIALAPLLFACASTTPRRAFALGLTFGLAATLGVAWWFPGMLQRYFGVAPPLGWLGLFAMGVTVDGIPYGLFAAWLAGAARRNALTPLRVAAAFGLAELARAHAPLANPYGLLGYSLHDTAFAQAADLAGAYGVGMLAAAASTALAAQFLPALARGRPRRALAWTAAAILGAFAYGEVRLAQSFGDGRPLRVALVQGAIERGLHWDRSARDANLARYLALNGEAARGAPELVFWPEFAVDFYLSEQTAQRERLLDGVRAGGADVVLGASRYALGARETRYFNSVYVIDRAGSVQSSEYDKQRLVPFSEYAPLGGWLRAASAVYAPGSGPRLLHTRALRVGAFVCGEALYPEVARGLTRAGAEILANPSNDYWFGAPQAAAEQLASAAFRAIENRRYLVRATSTGISAVIDAHGRVTARSRGHGPEIVAAELERSSSVTLYQLLGDGGVAAACLACVALSLFWRARETRSEGGLP